MYKLFQPSRDATGAAIAIFTAHLHLPQNTTHQTTLQVSFTKCILNEWIKNERVLNLKELWISFCNFKYLVICPEKFLKIYIIKVTNFHIFSRVLYTN